MFKCLRKKLSLVGVLFAFLFVGYPVGQLDAQPAGFTDQNFLSGWNQVVGLEFDPNGRMYVWEKGGKVWIVDNGVKLATPLVDISDEVGNWRDFGLLGFALDPNFLANGYVYLFYVVDREHLINFGTGNYDPNDDDYFEATIGRITRYQADPNTGFSTVIANSRTILLGATANAGPAILHESHGTGMLAFGEDGTLLACAGDGSSYFSVDEGSAPETYYAQALADGIITPQENVGSYRCQMLDSYSGKIYRIDPATGNGLPSNPYYDAANPKSPRSITWSKGHRNHYRFSRVPNTGSHYPADGDPGVFIYGEVGWGTKEELGVVHTGGLNMGWPKYEGIDNTTAYTNPAYWENMGAVHTPPKLDWRTGSARGYVNGNVVNVGSGQLPGNSFTGNAATGGVWYNGTSFPDEWQESYFFADYGGRWIRNVRFDASWNPIEVRDFINNTGAVVFIAMHPFQGDLYYVNYPGEIRKVSYTGGGNQPPVAIATSDVNSGNSPLTVNFFSTGSYDPEFGNLSYFWDFGDGTTSTSPNPSHIYTATGGVNFTATLTVTDNNFLTGQTTVNISLNNTPPQILSTSLDAVNTFDHINGANFNLSATVVDAETPGNLSYAWQTFLYHNDHNHPEAIDNNAITSTHLSPIGCDDGATLWYRVELTVTDPSGLSSFYYKDIYPDCPGTTQTLTFNPIPNKQVDDPSFTVSGSSTSGLSLIYYIASGPAVIGGNNITLLGVPGTVTVVATQPGNSTYAPAYPVFQTFEVLPPGPAVCTASGTINRQLWTGVAGATIADIPVNTPPTSTDELTEFEIPSNAANEYGTRLRGLICAPETGNYTFWIAGDESCELWLSIDDNPNNKVRIAYADEWTNFREWDKFTTQQSAPIALIEGETYYIEALHKEDTGGDHMSVRWQLPSAVIEEPMPGNRLSPYNIIQQDQTITFAPLEDKLATDPPFILNATASSGLNVSYEVISGPANVNGNTVTLTGTPGEVTIRATQAGDINYYPATPVEQTFNVIPVNTGGDADLELTVSTPSTSISIWQNSTLTVTLENKGPDTASDIIVDVPVPSEYNYTSDEVTGGYYDLFFEQWFITSLGANQTITLTIQLFALQDAVSVPIFCQVSASGAGDPDSYPNNNATGIPAEDDEGLVTFLPPGFGPQPQTITFPAIADQESDEAPFAITATASSGLAVNLEVVSGPATIDGNTVTLTGTLGTVTIEATQAGNASYDPATPVQQSFEVVEPTPDPQTITFPAIADQESDAAPFAVTATASSGLPVTLNIISGPATIDGNTITLTGTLGTVTVEATQAGNADYNAATPVQQSFQVLAPGLEDQTITFGALSNKFTDDAPFDVSATASSGLAVSFEIISGPATIDGTTITLGGTPGTVIVRASQAGDATYYPATPVDQSFDVNLPPGATDIDLELSVSVSNPELAIYTTNTFTLTLMNNGNVPATGITLSVPLPTGFTYTGDNTDAGYYDSFFETWVIPTVAAGQTVVLDLDLFVLANDAPIDFFAQVIEANENDSDSTPDNNATGVPAEDDEALVTVVPPGFGPQPQTITFDALADQESDVAPFAITATASSGLPVTLNIISGPATIDGNTITLTGALGTVTVEATQAGNANFNPATPVQQSFDVVEPMPDPQTITFPALADQESDAAPFAVTATASSGLPVTLNIISGPATIDGNTITLTGALGTVTVEATQAGNAEYNAATPVQQSFEVLPPGLEDQTITFGPLSDKFTDDAPFDVSATASSGLTVSFEIISGPATIDGTTITLNGTPGTVIVRASQAGDATYYPATPVNQSFDVNLPAGATDIDLELSVSVANPELLIYTTNTFTLSLTNNGNVPATGVTLSVPIPLGFTYTGDNTDAGYYDSFFETWVIPAVAVGETVVLDLDLFVLVDADPVDFFTQVIEATENDSDSTPNNNNSGVPAEDDEARVTVLPPGSGPQPQTITFDALADQESDAAPFAITATASSGLPVTLNIISGPATIDGNTITLTGALGTVTVEATQAGNANYNPATPVQQSFDVVEPMPDPQTITFPALANRESDEAPFDITATASSGLPVTLNIISGPATIDGTTITLTGATGTVTVEATQAGNAEYSAATPVQQSFEVIEPGLESQTITFGPLSDKFTDDVPFDVSATASSGLPVSFIIVSGPATINGTTITLDGTPGTVIVRASQTGDDQYSPATPVEQSFNVNLPAGATDIDLELAVTVSSPELAIYTTNTFTVTLTNNGNVAATGITVSVPLPTGFTYTGDVVDAGYYDTFFETWVIPSLAAGTSITLTLDLFTLADSAPIDFYVQVEAANENDSDSTPNNNAGPVPSEDDEAVVTVVPPGSGPLDQTITFVPIPDKITTDDPFAVSATASSGLPVTANIISGPASIENGIITLTGAQGSVIVGYSQAGNANYNAATTVFDNFDVLPLGPPTVVITAPTEGESIIGNNVTVNYTISGDLTGLSHLYFTVDGNEHIDVYNFTGTLTLENLALGAHTLEATLSGQQHIPFPNPEATDVVNFTTIPDPGPSDPPTGYCDAMAEQPWWQWISNVTFGDINHTSAKSQYSDFTDQSTVVVKGNAYTISLTPDFSWLPYDEHWRVWIDYNRDGDFDDAGEMVFEDHGESTVTGTITIPNTASNGATRMRIAMQDGAYADPCGTYTFGEVEDYTVQITGLGSLTEGESNAADLNFVAFKEDGDVKLHWLTNGVAVPHRFVLEQSDDGVYFNAITEVESKVISQQTVEYFSSIVQPENGTYFYRIQMVCDNGDVKISNPKMLQFRSVTKDISIFPNPTQDELFADLAKFSGAAGNITITNILGEVVYTKDLERIPSTLVQFDLSHLIDGNYVITFDFKGLAKVSKRFVINGK